MIKKIIYVACLLILWTNSVWAHIQDLRFSSDSDTKARFVIDLESKKDIALFRLGDPARLVIDVKNAKFVPECQTKQFTNTGFISGIRTGTPDGQTARIVLDLPNKNIQEKHFILPPQAGANWRFVLDMEIVGGVAAAATTNATKVGVKNFEKKSPVKKKVIVLDPGHGGQDPGAISVSGKYEKDLTLKMAKETKKMLERAGYNVVLTRDKDVFITLRGRIQKAHEANGDLFISIHADSARNRSAQGLSVYTISETASDKEAAALAERENKADILMGMDLGEYQPEVGNILIDFAKTYTMDQSAKYAAEVVKEMRKEVQLVPNAHRFAGFVVLKSPSIPSVLVELGYLSNKQEDKALQKESYRAGLSRALVRAVKTYFANTLE
ncbi:MAG: N-acetylmuramoyl-L-alanine amidase [Alphaproteobacteria bacterium]|nr:N-acetylmuramoyl-L-alanine amidase [Alphaproteobacteria bacterium]